MKTGVAMTKYKSARSSLHLAAIFFTPFFLDSLNFLPFS